MWKIEVTKDGVMEGYVGVNKHADDFARFIPGQHGVGVSDCKFYHLSASECTTLGEHLGEADENGDPVNDADYSTPGKLQVRKLSDSSLVCEVIGTEILWSQMYDQDMNFIYKS